MDTTLRCWHRTLLALPALVVDVRKGVHCMIPKHVFVSYRAAR